MSLEEGRTLLHYRLTEKLGEGGMGVVWRAVDTSLDRQVAVKILPEDFARQPDRLARFEREARLLASLNHPAIAAVYGLHECETGTGSLRFLAMELVEGEDLSQRLRRGSLPLEDALEVARCICEALEAAHDAGIVHRDLKPANVMLTPEGKVKVLDFGLAKLAAGAESSASGEISIPPTLTSAGTQAGMVLGTAAYMSPEQARGRSVDRRADIWALGCLLFEMLTDVGPFRGETVTDTLAAVVRADPDWGLIPPSTPESLRRLLRRALEKDPDRRLRDAGDLRLEIDEVLAGGEEPMTPVLTPSRMPGIGPRRWSGVLWALGGAVVALVAAAIWLVPVAPEPAARPARFEVFGAKGDTTIDPWSLSISPDGRRVVWTVVDGAHRAIHLRELDSLETRRLPDTDGAVGKPAFSPDGRSIAFYARGKLRRLDLRDRRAVDLCDSASGAGISWGEDGTLLFNDAWISALSRVSAEGGTPEPATTLDEEDGEIGHWFPQLLPDGRHVLISRWRTGLNDMSIAVASLDSGTIRDLVPRASFARYLPGGYLLFTRSGSIQIVPFDLRRLEVNGRPVTVVDGVEQQWSSGNSPWALSRSGVLVYSPGGLWSSRRQIVRVSRDGKATPMDVEPGGYLGVAMSPDGSRLALTRFENGETNVLIRDLARGVDTPLPSGDVNTWAVWSPDGREIAFTTARDGPWDIYRVPVDGSTEPEPLVADAPDQIPLAWSPDGRFLLWQEAYTDVRALDLLGDPTPKVILTERGVQGLAISPDSRWMAYEVWVADRREVVVRRFPDGTRDYRVSTDGGDSPLWSRDGRELFYRRGDAVFAASLRVSGDEIVAERPRELFRGDFVFQDDPHEWSYDPTTDELIMIRNGENEISRDRFVVALDWLDGIDFGPSR